MKNFYKTILTLIGFVLTTGTINAQTQLVTDGSFEAGVGSGNWIETSTSFGSPLCELAICGNGTGTGPHTGNIWAWFGGVAGNVESGSLTQSFVIPSGGTAILTFWLEQILCDGPQDFIQVTVDGNNVFTSDGSSSICGMLGYSFKTVDISAYADGNSHTLSFSSTTFSAFGSQTNIFLDDVSVIHSTGGGGSACADTTSFIGLTVAIPDDDANGTINAQTISGVPGTLGNNVQLKNVCFKIDHTWVGDLIVTLIAPNGTEIILIDRAGVPVTSGGCDGDNLNVCVEVGIGNEMEGLCSNLPAISGSYTAANGTNLGDINDAGGLANGLWQLFVSDNNASDTGILIEWSLVFDNGPVANWTSPGTVCATAGNLNLNSLVTGTSGGIWSGTGVAGNTFDPTGLNGPINITYSVSDLGTGCSDTETNVINVIAGSPVAGFSFTNISLTSIFNNFTVDGTTFAWNFGDGGISTDENPTYTYGVSGTYQVTLTATNACGISISSVAVTVLNCPDVVIDGSFEAGTGGGTWVATSTNLGTPICDTINCSTNGGTGPRTGTYWSSFGGIAQFEESSVSQDITIAVNSTATLYFWLEIPNCDSPDDFLKIAIDTDTLYAVNGANNNCSNIGYTLQSANLDAYDDGLPHTLKFTSKVYGINGGITNFSVDDIALIVCTGIGFAENSLNQHVSVMPVPASDFITINFTDIIASKVKIDVADVLGKNIFNSTIQQVNDDQSERIDVSGWSKGIYMLKVTSGSNSVNRKIIIQ